MTHLAILIHNEGKGDSRVAKQIATARTLDIEVTVLGLAPDNPREWFEDGVHYIMVDVPEHSKSHDDIAAIMESIAGSPPEGKITRAHAAALITELAPERAHEYPDIIHPSLELIYFGLRSSLATIDPDVIHANDYVVLDAAIDFAEEQKANGRLTKVIYDAHEWVPGYDSLTPARQAIAMNIEAQGIVRSDVVMTVSELIAEMLQSYYKLEERPFVVGNKPDFPGSALEGPTLRERLRVRPDEYLVVYSGSQGGGRDLELCVRGAALVPEVVLGFVVLAADTAAMTEVSRVAQELGMEDRLRFARMVPADQVVDYLRGADAGLIPFTPGGNQDIAVPTKTFEYAAAGVPLIVSDRPALKAHVSGHDIGAVYTTGDAESLAEAMRDVRRNSARYKRHLEQVLDASIWPTEETHLIAAWSKAAGQPLNRKPLADTSKVDSPSSADRVPRNLIVGTSRDDDALVIPAQQLGIEIMVEDSMTSLDEIARDYSRVMLMGHRYWSLSSDERPTLLTDLQVLEHGGSRCALYLESSDVHPGKHPHAPTSFLYSSTKWLRAIEHLGIPTFSPSRVLAQLPWITWVPYSLEPHWFSSEPHERVVLDLRPVKDNPKAHAKRQALTTMCERHGFTYVIGGDFDKAARADGVKSCGILIDELHVAGSTIWGARALASGAHVLTTMSETDRAMNSPFATHATQATIQANLRDVLQSWQPVNSAGQEFAQSYFSGDVAHSVLAEFFSH